MSVLKYLKHLEESDKLPARDSYYFAFKGFSNRTGIPMEELNPDMFKPNEVKVHIAHLSSDSAINAFISAVRGYINYMKDEVIDDADMYNYYLRLTDSLTRIKTRSTYSGSSPRSLSIDELKFIMGLTSEHHYLRVAVIIHFYLGARPIELAHPFKEETIDFDEMRKPGYKPKRQIDFEHRLINIITAKRKVNRVIPIDSRLVPYFEDFFEGHDTILKYCNGKSARQWLTKHLEFVKKKHGIYVTAKTARQTVETQMKELHVEQWMINYWLGHTSSIPDIYTDYSRLIPNLEENFASKHYIFKVLD